MLLNSKVNHDRKCVRIAFNGVEVDLEVSFSVCCKQKTRVGVAFTSLEWERLCNTVRFSTSKAIIITSDESGGSFVSKVINGFFAEMKFGSAASEYSNAGGVSKKTFVSVFSSCIDTKGYMQVLELTVGDRMLFEHASGTNNARNGLTNFIGNCLRFNLKGILVSVRLSTIRGIAQMLPTFSPDIIFASIILIPSLRI
nr:hypothetical protein [Tanacetum cinerariifolium]